VGFAYIILNHKKFHLKFSKVKGIVMSKVSQGEEALLLPGDLVGGDASIHLGLILAKVHLADVLVGLSSSGTHNS
jgi:hypothetical protein